MQYLLTESGTRYMKRPTMLLTTTGRVQKVPTPALLASSLPKRLCENRFSLGKPAQKRPVCCQKRDQTLCEVSCKIGFDYSYDTFGVPISQTTAECRFDRWRLFFSVWLFDDRGRANRLAEHLDVHRCNVSKWFVTCLTRPPAWAIVPTLEFFARETGQDNFATREYPSRFPVDHRKSRVAIQYSGLRNPENRKRQIRESRVSDSLARDFILYRIAVRKTSQLELNL